MKADLLPVRNRADPGASAARERRQASPTQKVLRLAAVMVTIALVLLAFNMSWGVHSSPHVIPWWILALACAAGDLTGFHVEIKKEAHTFTISEVPLIVGALFASPLVVVLARLVGAVAFRAIYRRQPAVKFVFNVALFLAETTIILTAVHIIGNWRTPTDWVSWPLILVAVTAAELLGGTAVAAVITWHGGRAGLLSTLPATLITSAVNVNLGLLASVILWYSPAGLALMALVLVGIAAAYRGYAGLSKRYSSLKHLYDFTRVLSADMSAHHVLDQVLVQARTLLRAQIAEVVVLDGGQTATAVCLVGSDGAGETSLISVPAGDPRIGWVDLVRDGRAVVVSRHDRNAGWSALRRQSGLEDLVLAPLRTNDTVTGVLLVGNRLGEISTFEEEDGRLFETLANHTSVAFENSRLLEQLQVEADQRRHEALHDALTGLPNRTLFAQSVAEAMEHHGSAVVMLMDLDRFKEVNDTLGHNNGDAVLREAARRVSVRIHAPGIVARLGGDEFAILLPGCTDLAAARVVAQGVIDDLQRPVNVEELSLSLGASIGISVAPDHGTDAVALLQRADVAMYQAKGSHESVAVYSPDDDTYSPGRLTLATELRTALQSGQISVCYQPKAVLADGTVIGTEALVRWNHPTRGTIGPDEFIPVAEQTGLIIDLTTYVLQAATRQCAEWFRLGYPVGVAVNLSVRGLFDPNLPRRVSQLLRQHNLPASCVTLEITESSILSDTDRAVAVLNQLSAAGVRLSLDDFGTGYSSLTYLQRLPVDEVKIDKSFVFNVANDPADAVIVQSIVELGHNLGLTVVAEGVEDQIAWDRLKAIGCDIAQGYLLSKPVPGPAATRWLEERHRARRGPSERERSIVPLRPAREHLA